MSSKILTRLLIDLGCDQGLCACVRQAKNVDQYADCYRGHCSNAFPPGTIIQHCQIGFAGYDENGAEKIGHHQGEERWMGERNTHITKHPTPLSDGFFELFFLVYVVVDHQCLQQFIFSSVAFPSSHSRSLTSTLPQSHNFNLSVPNPPLPFPAFPQSQDAENPETSSLSRLPRSDTLT